MTLTITRKAYLARIPGTGYFIRCPRWLYNRWPWTGVVHIWDEQIPATRENVLKRIDALKKAKAAHRGSASCEMPRTCGACHYYSGAIDALTTIVGTHKP